MKLLEAKNDVVFHVLFNETAGKEDLGVMLSEILKRKVKVQTIDKNRYVNIDTAKDKFGIMDLRAEFEDGSQCNIELQLTPFPNFTERLIYYWSDNFTRQLKSGDTYYELKKTICIAITDYVLENLKDIEETGFAWTIRDELTGKKVLTDKFEAYIIELPKVKKLYLKDKDNKFYQWMMFLDNPNSEEVSLIMKKNKDISSIADRLEQVSGDEKVKRIAELREKGRRDEQAALAYATEKGVEQGRAEGIEEGVKQNQIMVIQNMSKANMPIEQIEIATGLTKEKIAQIIRDNE